jgi:hypothetical protein
MEHTDLPDLIVNSPLRRGCYEHWTQQGKNVNWPQCDSRKTVWLPSLALDAVCGNYAAYTN